MAGNGGGWSRIGTGLRRVLAGTVVSLAIVAPVPAGAMQGCESGVTVVVDFAAFGGEVQARCAPGNQDSGLGALESAGFTVTMVSSQPGFLCRIDGEPAGDPCSRTPPGDAYWGYWQAGPTGDWAYATAGAASTTPQVGSVEGWAFSTPDTEGTPSMTPSDAVAIAAAGTVPQATDTADAGSGPSTGLVIGLGALVGIAAAITLSALRRRRSG